MPFGHHHHHHGILSQIEDELEQLSVSGAGSGSSGAPGARAQAQGPGIAPQPSYGQGYGTYPPSAQSSPYGPGFGAYGQNASQSSPGQYALQSSPAYGPPPSTQSYPPQQSYGQAPMNSPPPGYGQRPPQYSPQPPPSQSYNQGGPPIGYNGPPQQYNAPPPGQYPPQSGPQSYSPYPPQQGPPRPSGYPPQQGPAQSSQYSQQYPSQSGPQQYQGPPPPNQGYPPGQPYSRPPPGPPQYNQSQPQSGGGSGYGGMVAGAAVAGSAALAYGAYEHYHNQNQNQGYAGAPPPDVQMPASLNPQQFTVQFTPLHSELKHCTHHHTMKLLSESHHSVQKMSQVIGTYLMAKEANGHSSYGTAGSRREIREYYYELDMLEKLSADFLSKHSSKETEWKEAIGPHRRQTFCQLYNRNELVRAFCSEMIGGPLHLPQLDRYSLGEKVSMLHIPKSAVQQANKRAALDVLARVRTVLLIDDSYSMTEPGHHTWGSRSDSRWDQTRGVIAELTPLVAQHNAHGVDLHLLNRIPFYAGLRTTAAAEHAMNADRPNNGTPTGARVNDILDAYLSVLRYYRHLLPMNLIVITDGEANDEEVLHQAIEHHVTEMYHRGFPGHQFGIEFVQVGDDESATRHLEKLEREVSRHHHKFQRDVVGVTPTNRIAKMHAQELLAVAVSGIDARLNSYMRHKGVNV